MRLSRILMVFCFMLVCLGASGKNGAVREVLILHSYTGDTAWTAGIDRGLRGVLTKSGLHLAMATEFMDTKNNRSSGYYDMLERLYRYKYGLRRFSVILCSDNNALDFLVERGERLFPGVPVVFCGVNNYTPAMLRGRTNFTGVIEAIDFRATLDTALALHPDTKRIVGYGYPTTTFRMNYALLRQALRKMGRRLPLRIESNRNIEEVRRELRTLPSGTLIVIIENIRDGKGRMLSFTEYPLFIRRHTKLPVYSFWDFSLGYGTVGGKLVSGEGQGEAASRLGLRILQGTPVSGLPVIRSSPNRYMFDEQELRRFGIDRSRLPAGSILINHEPGFLERHSEVIAPVFMAFLVVLLFLMALALSNHRRKTAERGLREQKELLDHFFSLTPVGAAIFGTGDILRFANQEFTRITGYYFEDLNTPEKWFNALYPDPGYREEIASLWKKDKEKLQGYRQIRIRCKDGSERMVEFRAAFLRDGISLVTIVDITDRIESESALKRSLEEKEVLLKEIHHRVKNNLQIISSMLNMQMGKTHEEGAVTALQESKQRVFTMAMIHEELYVSEDLTGIDLSHYLPRLTSFIFGSMTPGTAVAHRIRIDPVVLPLEKAIPCGLIVNEALTNAFKHGCSGPDSEIRLEVVSREGGVTIRVSDTGPGFPDGFRAAEGETLGMQLISVLTKQLRGTLDCRNENGAVVEVSFRAEG